MKAQSMINTVKRYTDQYGVKITWNETLAETNSRGKNAAGANSALKTARVLILKEKFNPLQPVINAMGLSHDYARYVLCLPDIDLKKDMVITDNHNMKWKLGIFDWFDVAGTPVAKQSALTEVMQ